MPSRQQTIAVGSVPLNLGRSVAIALIDAMCDAQDRRDRAAQAQPSAAENMLVLAQAVMAQQAAIMKLLLDQSRTKTPKPERRR
jgi:hypothetical protein